MPVSIPVFLRQFNNKSEVITSAKLLPFLPAAVTADMLLSTSSSPRLLPVSPNNSFVAESFIRVDLIVSRHGKSPNRMVGDVSNLYKLMSELPLLMLNSLEGFSIQMQGWEFSATETSVPFLGS